MSDPNEAVIRSIKRSAVYGFICVVLAIVAFAFAGSSSGDAARLCQILGIVFGVVALFFTFRGARKLMGASAANR